MGRSASEKRLITGLKVGMPAMLVVLMAGGGFAGYEAAPGFIAACLGAMAGAAVYTVIAYYLVYRVHRSQAAKRS